jgi:type I site-specific restriction endonuclease
LATWGDGGQAGRNGGGGVCGCTYTDFMGGAAAKVQADKENQPDNFWGEPICAYPRAQAIADGVLVERRRPLSFRARYSKRI